MASKVLVFDLDGTLYDADNGYVKCIRQNVFQFMVEKGFASTVNDAEEIWKPLFKKYNQTYKGLIEGGYEFEKEEYWSRHRSQTSSYFKQDDKLIQLFNSFKPIKKVIFTNCREKEAKELLE